YAQRPTVEEDYDHHKINTDKRRVETADGAFFLDLEEATRTTEVNYANRYLCSSKMTIIQFTGSFVAVAAGHFTLVPACTAVRHIHQFNGSLKCPNIGLL
uniref:Uncharacterized protein n=1 Tax=Romanomermis culicivorax TaxID=13658 RepID=A0A915J7M6_ROMCU